MTRETKIGLLVGLAFIIVIGILLSDHINSSTDLAPAAMGQTYNAVERGAATPDSRTEGTMAMVAPRPAPVIPHNQVPTQVEPATPADPGSTIVVIGAGGDPSKVRIPSRPIEPRNNAAVQVLPPENPLATDDASAPATPGTADPVPSDPLQKLVQDHRDELTGPGTTPVKLTPPTTPTASAPVPAGMRQVKAEEGDTVSKLATKYLGVNNKANRAAIIKANPSMTEDGHLVIAGRTYFVPGVAAAPVAVNTEAPPTPRPQPATAKPAPGVTMYTVKDNDSLWKIASEQLGSGTRWTEIRDLNQDVLKGAEQVHANMRIKLPPKTVAAAN